MEYGKPFGVGMAGGATLFGISAGYGWFILVALVVTLVTIVLIRQYFRRGKVSGAR